MATTSGARLRAAEVLAEIQARLALAEAHVEDPRRRYRALPADHPARGALSHQLEVAAAVAYELADLEGLVSGRPEV